jgi:hypothetical protein
MEWGRKSLSACIVRQAIPSTGFYAGFWKTWPAFFNRERDDMNEILQVLTAALAATLTLYIWLCWLVGIAVL